jgi:flagellar biosynthesis protein FlhF
MKYVTIVAPDFDEAVRKAHKQFGSNVRIHTRRDIDYRGGLLWLKKLSKVELSCYIVDPVDTTPVISPPEEEQVAEAVLEVKEEQPQEDPLITHAKQLLRRNSFSETFISDIIKRVEKTYHEQETTLTKEEFELLIVDTIVSLVSIDHHIQLRPPRIFALIGPTGIGKTTTIAKIAALYTLQQEDSEYYRSVHMITIDSFRIGAFEQLNSFGRSLNIPVDQVSNEQEFYAALDKAQQADLILIDTIGRSPKDKDVELKMKTLLSVAEKQGSSFFLAINASMKEEDLHSTVNHYKGYNISGVIITKVDESSTVGNVLSICYEQNLPLLFFTDGQRVPKDIHKASATYMLSLLRDFSLDFGSLWANQIGSVPNLT